MHFQLHVMYLQTVLKNLFNHFFQVVEIAIENNIDSLQINTLLDSRELREKYRKKLVELFVRKGAIIVRHFQLDVNANVLLSLYKDFRPDTDYNSTHLKRLNEHLQYF